MIDDKSILRDLENQTEDELMLRPQYLNQYIGQNDIKEMLSIYIQAAIKRSESLDHVLLYGAPGLGKTTLAQIIANELGVNIKITSGPAIEKTGDLAALLTSLQHGDVLFIDEIHRLPRFVEEVLYSAMEDYVLDIVLDKERDSRSIRIELPPFTLVGATTRFGDLSHPLRERFGAVFRLSYYTIDEIKQIVRRTSNVYQNKIDELAVDELSKRSRGTPRIANRLFRRVRDFAEIMTDGVITYDVTNLALTKLGIDQKGLDSSDYLYLKGMIERFNGGPVGLESIASTIGEEPGTIEDVFEPFLLQEGYIKRTPRGRVATEKAYELLGKKYYKGLLET
ncbi:Holliday junction ATP-dependent DNA helicase RuvB [Acholeplasma oculi]|uniref:Holliday junction branch migration complex subunit RuvB n=1 Tax=Acholeplasma oculi TaxID=35623 RepID=A0A061AB71_9MOLU|nr:Holliday junction branch migration DNA helicase RuvB [Acholeplasma oculi]CDR31140.1 Holliday junction DNA helicase RuvB [Acholeplasma oculi]SKC37405.1 Holliday junction DNA helicase subunit RuvB [Acholeplasma oculi]SUT90922.1 Holliday junction ATP-dependent DNA helicase RuvB [Acholeplasma oculi]